MQNLISKTIDLQNGTPDAKRIEIRNYFEKTWAIDEKLYSQLAHDEVFYHRGDPLRHILLFYLGHTAVFYINKLFLAKLIDTRINPAFESIFAIGVDEMSWDDLNEKHYDWPAVEAVRDYRNKAKKVILNCIDNFELQLPILWNDPFWIIMMGIEHERIHLETSSVLIRQLPLHEVVSGNFGNICTQNASIKNNEYINVKAQKLTLGKLPNHKFYGWDNEYGKFEVAIDEFEASKMLVSNAEFLAFVEDKAYENENYWTEEGWQWRNFKQATMPLFWHLRNGKYFLRLVAEEIEMPWSWPVEINYLEAKAFCNWKTAKEGKTHRLPTEAEWYAIYAAANLPDMDAWEVAPGNINLEHYSSPCPVDMFAQGDFFDVIGNVWQWTESPITGYPGFKVHPLYDDFSTPTFDTKHNLIKGGSWISTGNEATKHARYAFRRHFYQHAGFRIVRSEKPLVIENNEYETDREVANSCEDMWTAKENFCTKLAKHIVENIANTNQMNVLDLNPDTGRLAFELAPFVKKITAIDASARYIRMPIQLQNQGYMRFIVKDEGELLHYREQVLADYDFADSKHKIQFMQDNANNLKPLYTGYDLLVAPQLLEELTCPILFLKNIHERINNGGYLVISSTYDWTANNIKVEHWPGGFKKDGEPVSSFEGIKALLAPNFELVQPPIDIELKKHECSRIKTLQNCEVSIWRKKH